MSILYQNMGTPLPGESAAVPMTETNVGPALILWLLFTTNPNWATPPDRLVVSKALGLNPQVFDYYKRITAKFPEVNATAGQFSSIAHDTAGYPESHCPGLTGTILALAPALPAVKAFGKKIAAAKAKAEKAEAAKAKKAVPKKKTATKKKAGKK